MSTVYPVELFRHRCYISEHLFIALRFSEHSDLEREIIEYKNSLWCKKSCINGKKSGILPPSQQAWQLFWCGCDEVHRQPQKPTERRFRKLLDTTKGKIIVKETTLHNASDAVLILRWEGWNQQKRSLSNRPVNTSMDSCQQRRTAGWEMWQLANCNPYPRGNSMSLNRKSENKPSAKYKNFTNRRFIRSATMS